MKKEEAVQAVQQLTFAHYRLDLVREQLWREHEEIPLPGQVFALLRYLVEHAGRLVSKAELFAALWPGTAVTDGALTFCIVELRKALGDNAKAPRFIETVHRRGYRFLPAVTTTPVVSSQHSVVSSGEEARNQRLETSSSSHQVPSLKPLVPRFVGRDAELTYLHNLLAKAFNGERQVVFVTGEPGIGKTTLIDAFLLGARGWGLGISSSSQSPILNPQSLEVWVGRGQCIEQYGPGEAYMPILEALGRLCREPEGERLIYLLRHHAPTWLVQLPALLPTAELEVLQRQTQGVTRERMLRGWETPSTPSLPSVHWYYGSKTCIGVMPRRWNCWPC